MRRRRRPALRRHQRTAHQARRWTLHEDSGLWRCSHHNPYIKELYDEFLGAPASHKAEPLLHTGYQVLPEYKR